MSLNRAQRRLGRRSLLGRQHPEAALKGLPPQQPLDPSPRVPEGRTGATGREQSKHCLSTRMNFLKVRAAQERGRLSGRRELLIDGSDHEEADVAHRSSRVVRAHGL